jgi:hypothetical protein
MPARSVGSAVGTSVCHSLNAIRIPRIGTNRAGLHSNPVAEKEKRKPRVLTWERVPPDEVLRDKPVSKLFEPPEDRKGWDRASLTLNTHPLHRSPRFGPDDLRLPRRTSRVKLAGDSVAITILICLAFMFPLWVASVIVDSDLRWAWVGVGAFAIACGALLFARGVVDEQRPPEDFLKELP